MRPVTIITLTILIFCIANVALAIPSDDNSPAINETIIPAPELAPLNPAFIEYMEKLEENEDRQDFIKSSSLSTGESIKERYPVNGLIPSPVDNSHIYRTYSSDANDIFFLSASEETLPSYYDLRNESRVTPVRNQATSGSCWAFAAYASLESCMIPDSGFYDFSENHLKNIMSENYSEGYDQDPNIDGGNCNKALAYLTRWTGPVNESDDPYNDTSIYSDTSIPERKHVQEVIYLPDRDYETSHDDDFLKNAVMKYGAVYSSFAVNWTGFDDNALTYYYNETNYVGGHAVALVGWNDSYPKENFNIIPPGDGAFICKNSWNTSVGDEGYFYISYYEQTFNRDMDQIAVFVSAEEVDNYDNIYQYDPLGYTDSMGYENETINVSWAANIFTAGSNEYLNAVSFYTPDEMTDYELYIYINPDKGPINSSGYEYFTSGTFEYAGYHTLDLSETVILKPNQNFSVVINFTDPDYANLVAIEKQRPNYSSKATANPGEGYVSPNGTSWSDITESYENTSICIKAFTDEPHVAKIILDPVNDTIYAGETLQFNEEAFDQYNYPIDANVVWSCQNETVGTINATSGLFTAHITGNTTILASNCSVTNSTNITVLDRPVFSITVDEPQEGYNYSTGSIFLNVSANLEVNTWMYNVNSTGNHTFTPNITLTLPEGKHNVTVFANDTVGNVGSAMVNFTIDIPPLPSTPRKTSSSSSGGGGSGNTGEAFGNIALKEVKTIFTNKDSEIIYHFEEEDDKIEYIGFYSLKNSGRVSATIEVLNGKSTLVTENPPGMAYQHMNIWVGKAGFATETNIVDPVIGFRVSKSWIVENDIDETTITLCRNHDGKWTQLSTTILNEDMEYIYFEATTPGFSPFAIVGSAQQIEVTDPSSELADVTVRNSTVESNTETASESMSLPLLSNGILMTILGCAYLALRKRS
ncbi:PGF-pre-PGF domain-containing protein [Methanococcoides orientis]|uniref:PGF-pre-PGF domain-containing protein n=1 Tax=Methanococcoides orientis TaxID=2822137 RepID=UPI001E3193AD|nr:PGF-pre-PGF domain-containing protein [Methanococcoides orientis]UGV40655.1 PGF-pre-PGF domain-containing protein [Methanococcoides orientis]